MTRQIVDYFDLRKQQLEQGAPFLRYFYTVRVPRDDGLLHRTYHSEVYHTLSEVRNIISLLLDASSPKDGTVLTIFRINKYQKSETIEHAVVVKGKVHQAYRTSKKWYEEVAPFIKTSYYYQNSHLPPFLREELNLQGLEE